MTAAEWKLLAAEIQATWPQTALSDATLAAWGGYVAEIDLEDARVALRSLALEGREFAPTGAMIAAEVTRRSKPSVDHGYAWSLAMDAVRRFGSYNPDKGREWLAEQNEATAIAVDRIGWSELCLFNLDDLPTVRAQFREIYKGVVESSARERRQAALPGGPKRLEPQRFAKLGRVVGDD